MVKSQATHRGGRDRKGVGLIKWLLPAVVPVLLTALVSCDILPGPPADTLPPAETVTKETTETSTHIDTEEETVMPPAQTSSDESCAATDEDPSQDVETDSSADTETAPEVTTFPEVPPCPHTPVPVPSVPSTCTEAGKTEGAVCGDCGEILRNPTEIPPTGHAYTAYLCGICGHRATCPTPAFNESGELTHPFGESLTLTWQEADGLYPVVYTLTVTEEGGEEATILADTDATSHTLILPAEGATYTLRLYALYAEEGHGVPETAQAPAELKVYVPMRHPLEPPAFITGTRIVTYVGKPVTVTWNSPEEDGLYTYTTILRTPEGEEALRLTDGESSAVTLGADLLTREGTYTLSVTVSDPLGKYRDSEAATLEILVKPAEAELEEAFRDPERYHSDYFYEYLGTKPNAAALQSFYKDVHSEMTAFHTRMDYANTVKLSDGSVRYYAAKMDYKRYGLTLEEAASVRFCYVYDHPLFYWVSNFYVYSSTHLYFCIDEAYADGEDRAACNEIVYSGAAEMAASVYGEASPYRIALAYYEMLLATADYAYEEDGETPRDDPWAHNIIGLFDKDLRGVVCEGFAEAYSLMLNFHGVDCIQVPGLSRGVGHLWNLVRMDDGQWYWCDITWDDKTHSPLGTDYKYFLVTDTQDVLYYYVRDGIEAGYDYTFTGSATFMDDHTVRWDPQLTLDMSDAIPPRAESPYKGSDPTLREIFRVEGMTYAVVGYNQVQLVEVTSGRQLTVPETVAYGDRLYTVVSIGLISEDGIYMKGRLLPLFTTSVYIPKTVRYVWDNALSGLLVTVTVDPGNPYYTVKNGQLVAKGG